MRPRHEEPHPPPEAARPPTPGPALVLAIQDLTRIRQLRPELAAPCGHSQPPMGVLKLYPVATRTDGALNMLARSCRRSFADATHGAGACHNRLRSRS